MPHEPQTWHYGLVARWWAVLIEARPRGSHTAEPSSNATGSLASTSVVEQDARSSPVLRTPRTVLAREQNTLDYQFNRRFAARPGETHELELDERTGAFLAQARCGAERPLNLRENP